VIVFEISLKIIFLKFTQSAHCYVLGQSDQLDQKDQKLQNRLIFDPLLKIQKIIYRNFFLDKCGNILAEAKSLVKNVRNKKD
jgi:hypothetical protein